MHTITCTHVTAQTHTDTSQHKAHGIAQHSTAHHSTAQHSTSQHSTAQHRTAQTSTAQHSTVHHTSQQTQQIARGKRAHVALPAQTHASAGEPRTAAPGRAGLTFRHIPVWPALQFGHLQWCNESTFPERQRSASCSSYSAHLPQAMLNGTLTRSPTLTNSQSRPASTTSPVLFVYCNIGLALQHARTHARTRDTHFVAQRLPGGRRRAASHHVLIAPADVACDNLQNNAMVALSPLLRELQFRKRELLVVVARARTHADHTRRDQPPRAFDKPFPPPRRPAPCRPRLGWIS